MMSCHQNVDLSSTQLQHPTRKPGATPAFRMQRITVGPAGSPPSCWSGNELMKSLMVHLHLQLKSFHILNGHRSHGGNPKYLGKEMLLEVQVSIRMQKNVTWLLVLLHIHQRTSESPWFPSRCPLDECVMLSLISVFLSPGG